MNTDELEAVTDLIRSIESAEEGGGLFLVGTAQVVRSDGAAVATLTLRGSSKHHLVVAD